jgi:hypothetical protein
MASVYGRGLYSAGSYSRDFSKSRNTIAGTSFIAVQASVQHYALVQITAASSVEVIGRLLWDHVPLAPCEGAWTPLTDLPCRRAA